MILKLNEYRLAHVKNYLVIEKYTDETDDDFLNRIAEKLNNKIDMLQFNQGNISTKEYYLLGKKLRELCSIFNVIFIIKNRIDVAKAVNADGIILEENELPPDFAKEFLEENSIIGLLTTAQNPDLSEFDYFYNPKNKSFRYYTKI